MELNKCVIEGKYKSVFYSKRGEPIDEENSVLLGFKDKLAVLSHSMVESNSNLDLPAKKTLKVVVNSQTGEKFINLYGKKLKMVTESELPPQLRQNTHLMKVASTNGLASKKPVTFKILGTMSSLFRSVNVINNQESREIDQNNFKPNVNKADSISDELSHKTMLIKENKPHTVKNPSISRVSTAEASTLANCVNGIQEDAKCTEAKFQLNDFKDCETKDYSGVLDMKTSKPAAVSTDQSIQIDRDHFQNDKCVQTEEIFAPIIENLDFCNLDNFDDVVFDNLISAVESNPTIPIKTINMPETSSKNINPPVQDKRLLMFYNDLNEALRPDVKGNMPIHVAVLTNDVDFLKRSCNVLKALQQSVDLLNHSELTALQLAVLNDANPEIVKVLLNHNASLDVTDSEGNNILHLAVEFERIDILDLILKASDQHNFSLDQFNAEGMTALMICSCNRFHKCADLLLKFDADVNVRDRKSGRTALFHAAENFDYDMVQILLANKADTKIKNFFGTSPHDAMYEVEEIPDVIKLAILGRSSKRKLADEPKLVKVKKVEEIKPLKTYARFKKCDFSFGENMAGQVKEELFNSGLEMKVKKRRV